MGETPTFIEEIKDEIFVGEDNLVEGEEIFREVYLEGNEISDIASKYGIKKEAIHHFESYCTNDNFNKFGSAESAEDALSQPVEDVDVDHKKEGPAGFIHQELEGRNYSLSPGGDGYIVKPHNASQTLKVVPKEDEILIENDYTVKVKNLEKFGNELVEQFQELEMKR